MCCFDSSVLFSRLSCAAFTATVFMATAFTATPSEARLPEAFSNLPKEIVRNAVHMPTGCIARIVLNERTVVSAAIVDPDCLPRGVRARSVPGRAHDFRVIDSDR